MSKPLRVLVKRVSENPKLSVFGKGFGGCGKLCRKACSHIKDFASKGASRFIVCHDSDGTRPRAVKERLEGVIRAGNCSTYNCSIVVPIEELESWIIADEKAIQTVISTLSITSVASPESLNNPKEWLRSKSRVLGSRPLFIPSIHNKEVLRHTNLDKLATKCPSFIPLREFVRGARKASR